MKTASRIGTIVVAAFAWSGVAHASFVTSCPGTAVTTDREFSIEISASGATCNSGTGNLNGNGDVVNLLGYVTLDKSDDATTGVYPSAIKILTGSGTAGLSGSFSFNAPGYQDFVVALKSGEGRLDPDWAYFILPAGVNTVDWKISGDQALSHINLYGKVSTVPLPAAAWLLLSGLGGLGVLGRRRKAA